MACTDSGVAVKSTTKGINVKAGTKAADTPRRTVYGRTKVGGFWIYSETTGTTNEYLHLIIGLCDGPIEEIETIYFGNEIVTLDGSGNGTGKWTGAVHIEKHLGDTGQAANAALVAASAGKWTTGHQLRGIAYLYVRLDNWDGTNQTPSPAVFGSVPDISAVIKGRNDVTDVRTGLVGYSANPALCLAHYRQINRSSPIDSASIAAAATYCDTLVGLTRSRYTVGGMIEATASVDEVTRQFLAAMAASITVIGDGHFLRIGIPEVPTYTITWDSLRASPTMQRISSTGDTATVSAATEATNWQATDAASSTDAAKAIKLDLVNDGEQAQQLAAIENAKNGPTETISCAVALALIGIAPGDAVEVDFPPMAVGRFNVVSARLNLELVPTIELELERQRASIYEDIETVADTIREISVSARILTSPTHSLAPATYPTANYPLTPTISAQAGAVIRWSLTATPTSESDGYPYFENVSIPAPGIGNFVTLYTAVFKSGWTSASRFTTYGQS